MSGETNDGPACHTTGTAILQNPRGGGGGGHGCSHTRAGPAPPPPVPIGLSLPAMNSLPWYRWRYLLASNAFPSPSLGWL